MKRSERYREAFRRRAKRRDRNEGVRRQIFLSWPPETAALLESLSRFYLRPPAQILVDLCVKNNKRLGIAPGDPIRPREKTRVNRTYFFTESEFRDIHNAAITLGLSPGLAFQELLRTRAQRLGLYASGEVRMVEGEDGGEGESTAPVVPPGPDEKDCPTPPSSGGTAPSLAGPLVPIPPEATPEFNQGADQ